MEVPTNDLNTCYTCLHNASSLTDLLKEDVDNITYMTKLSKLLNSKLIPQDAMGVCAGCVEHLRISHQFLETTTESQKYWRKCLDKIASKTIEIKTEKNDITAIIENKDNVNSKMNIMEQNSPYNDYLNDNSQSDHEETTDHNSFTCAECLKDFSDKEFLSHNCFKSSKYNEIKSDVHSKINSNMDNMDYNSEDNFQCVKCLKLFSDEEFLLHDCFKSSQQIRAKKSINDCRKSNLNKTTKRKMQGSIAYQCAHCQKTFDNKQLLHKHIRNIHILEIKEEAIEETNTTDSVNVPELELVEMDDENTFECAKCLYVFSDEEFLLHECFQSKQPNRVNNHKSVSYKQSEIDREIKRKMFYKCSICQQIFRRKQRLHSHMKVHNPEDKYKYKCRFCKKTFRKALHVTEHLTFHTGVKNFSCDICEKSFRLLSSQQRHMKSHTAPPGQKAKKTPFLCTICGRHFPYSNGYQRHMRVHSGIRNHECTICFKKFQMSTHLKVHMRIHTGEKPYVCDVCGEPYSFKTSLNKHISKIHGGEPSHFKFMCIYCGQNFTKNADLQHHINRNHSSTEDIGEPISKDVENEIETFTLKPTRNKYSSKIHSREPSQFSFDGNVKLESGES